MQNRRLISLLASGLWLAGCSSTLVVLVPDPTGKVGEVSVNTGGGQEILSQAGASTEVSSVENAPEPSRILTYEKIRDLFAVALANEPDPPQGYLLYFQFDSAALRPKSKRLIPEIYRAVRSRVLCDASVIGHTDRAGNTYHNWALSIKRAEAVAKVLRNLGIPERCMDIRYYGESDPLVPTADGVLEPRNRRVEVEIR